MYPSSPKSRCVAQTNPPAGHSVAWIWFGMKHVDAHPTHTRSAASAEATPETLNAGWRGRAVGTRAGGGEAEIVWKYALVGSVLAVPLHASLGRQ